MFIIGKIISDGEKYEFYNSITVFSNDLFFLIYLILIH